MRLIWRYLIMSSLPMYKITPTVTATAAPINFHHFICFPRLARPADPPGGLRSAGRGAPHSYPPDATGTQHHGGHRAV